VQLTSPDSIARGREPNLDTALLELRCIVRWGLRNWMLAVLLALVGAGGLGFLAYRKAPMFTSKVIIDVRTTYDEDEPPPSAREVKQYIDSVVLSDSALTELVRPLGFNPRDLELFRALTLSKIRDSIGISIDHESPVRADQVKTRLSISFSAKSAEGALNGSRALADHIVAFQNKVRVVGGRLEEEVGERSEDELNTRLSESERRLASLTLQLAGAKPTDAFELRMKINQAQVEVEQLTNALDRVSRRTRKVALRNNFERDMSGAGYVIVDRGQLPPPKRISQTERAVIAGIAGFFGLFVGLVLVIGGLSFRVYDADSLRRLGLRSIGEVKALGLGSESWWARRKRKETR
jgi:hypothetical protein